MKAQVKEFRGYINRPAIFSEKTNATQLALNYATDLGPDRVINITTSVDQTALYVRVWYWSDAAVVDDEHVWEES